MQKIISFCLLLLLNNTHANAQSKMYYSVKNITTKPGGLSQGSSYFRHEDKQGFMWITANNAVNRYDGCNVKVYNLDRYFINCSPLTQGINFTEDEQSNLYIGSEKGIYIYHRNKDNFTLVEPFGKNADAIPIGWYNNELWCFNKNWEVVSYNPSTNQSKKITSIPFAPLPSVHVYAMGSINLYAYMPSIDTKGNIWFFSPTAQVISYNIITAIQQQHKLLPGMSSAKIDFAKCYADTLYAYINNYFIKAPCNNTASIFLKKIPRPDNDWASFAINDTAIIMKNYDGIFLYNKQFELKSLLINNGAIYPRGFNFDFDKSGRLWFCNDGLGQVIFNFAPRLLPKKPDETSGINETVDYGVGQLAELDDGKILATLKIYDPIKKVFNPYKYSFGEWSCKFGSTKTNKGIYVCYFDKNFFVVKLVTSKKEIKLIAKIPSANNENIIQDVTELQNGNVMVSTNRVIYIINPFTKQQKKITNLPSQGVCFKVNPLPNDKYIISFVQGTAWLTTISNDSIIWEKEVLPTEHLYYIQALPNYQYAAATNTKVYILNDQFKAVKKYDVNNGLAGNTMYGLLTDSQNNVWVSHERGLSTINTTTNHIINFTKEDGIQDYDFNNRCFLKAKDGTLYFGGIKGFNHIKPPLYYTSVYTTETYIDDIFVNNTIYDNYKKTDSVILLNLQPTQNNIVINLAAKNLQLAEDEKIAYRLNDAPWVYATNPAVITYSSLASGTYNLQVATYERFTGNLIIQKTITINIAKYFYATTGFVVVCTFILFGSLFWLVERRRKQKQQKEFDALKTKQQETEKLAAERQRITADLHDEIGSSLSSLQVNSTVANHLINTNSEKAKTVIQKIETQSQQLGEKLGDFIWSMKPGKDEFVTLSSRIKTFANDLMGSTHMNYHINIDTCVDNALTEVQLRKNILLITKEAINNAVKYSAASQIDISIERLDQTFVITVADNGEGFNVEEVKGNGLRNMQKRAEELQGKFEIISEPKKGSKIIATIPIP